MSLATLGSGKRTPSFTFQPGPISACLKPRQPAVVLPSNSSFQPAAFSWGVSVLSAAQTGAAARSAMPRPSANSFITVILEAQSLQPFFQPRLHLGRGAGVGG